MPMTVAGLRQGAGVSAGGELGRAGGMASGAPDRQRRIVLVRAERRHEDRDGRRGEHRGDPHDARDLLACARAAAQREAGQARWLRRTAGQSVGSVGSPNSVMKIIQNIGTTRRNIPEIAPIAAAAGRRPAASARPAPPR